MVLYDIGPYGVNQASAVATLSQSPLADRANIVTRLLIDKPSAADVWRVYVAGRELVAFDIQTTGNQQPLSGPYSAYPKNNDFFALARQLVGQNIRYPIPQGQTLTVKSDGGATANITIQFLETQPGEVTPGMINHPNGSRFVLPIVMYRNANVTAAGESPLDTQVAPTWFPNLSVAGALPPNWTITVLGMFLEGQGRNTFSGSADHQSVTSYLYVIRNGQRLFTRAATGGLVLIGQASATGSANTVTSTDETLDPPFQETDLVNFEPTTPPLVFQNGQEYVFGLGITGDVTGGATYAAARQLLLCDVRTAGGV
jgi:hypothetical protein